MDDKKEKTSIFEILENIEEKAKEVQSLIQKEIQPPQQEISPQSADPTNPTQTQEKTI